MNAVCAVSKRKLILGEKGEGGRKKERKKGRRTIKERGRRERERWKEGTTMHKVSQDARGNVATGGGGGTKTYNGHNGRWILSLSLPTVWALGWVRRRYSSRRTFEKITSSGLSAPFSSSFSLSKVAFSIVGIRRTDPFFTRCAWLWRLISCYIKSLCFYLGLLVSRLIFYPIEWIYSNALIDIPRGATKVGKNSGEIDRAIFFFLFFHPRKRETRSIAVYPKFVRLTSGE